MPETTPEQRQELLELAEKATPRPWECGGEAQISLTFDRECNIFPPDTIKTHGFQFGGPVAVINYKGESDANPDGADALYIVAACNLAPGLARDVERLRSQMMWLIQMITEDENYGSSAGISLRPPMNGHGWRLYGFDGDFIGEADTPVGIIEAALAAGEEKK